MILICPAVRPRLLPAVLSLLCFAVCAAPRSGVAAPRETRLGAGGVAVTSLDYDARVFFDTDRDRPRPEAASVLDGLAERLRGERPAPHVAVVGHADATGTDAYNMQLSRRRAEAVVRALTGRGVLAGSLEAVAVGMRQPVASDEDAAGRAQNRRVEFLISPSEAAIEQVIARRGEPLILRVRHPLASPVQRRVPAPVARAPLGPDVSY